MAVPLAFKPEPVNPREELMKQLESAPREHAEAILVALQTLQTAHDKGILDLVNGLLGGREIIAAEMAKAMKSTAGVNAIRNAIALGTILASLDPEMMHRMSAEFTQANEEYKAEEKPPSMWAITKRVFSEDGRRGLSFASGMLTALGGALKKP